MEALYLVMNNAMDVEDRKIAFALYSDLVKFFEFKKFCDVYIKVDGRYFPSHSFLLGAVSEYFDDLFGDNFEAKDERVITIPPAAEINVKAFQEFLEYIHRGCITVTELNKRALFHISEILRLRFTFAPQDGYQYDPEHWVMMYKLLTRRRRFDINLRLQNESFQCHSLLLAAASEHIDEQIERVSDIRPIENPAKMRKNNNKTAQPAELRLGLTNIVGAPFKVILEFIYTGQVQIPKLLCHRLVLLATCRSLRLRTTFIQKRCFESLPLHTWKEIEATHPTVPYALEIFSLAREMNEMQIVNDFLSPYICKHLIHFSKHEEFLNMTFDDLLVILDKRDRCPSNVCVILRIIVCWIHYIRFDREKYFNSLVSKIVEKETYLPSRYWEFIHEYRSLMPSDDPSQNVFRDGNGRAISLMDKIITDMDEKSELADGKGHPSAVESTEKLTRFFRFDPGGFERYSTRSIPSVHVYVRYADTGRIGVFSTNRIMRWANTRNYWANTYEFCYGVYSAMRTIAVGNILYHLRCDPDFHTPAKEPFPMFTARKSVYNFPSSFLREPPRLVENFDMCGAYNRIYLYNGTPAVNASDISQYRPMETGSIYGYNIERNRWYAIPPTKEKVSDACMTVDKYSQLYLIGGDKCYAQAYDWRTKRWRKLASPARQYLKYETCVHHDKIYVGGVHSGLENEGSYILDTYDLAAGKWNLPSSNGLLGTSYTKYYNEGVRLCSYNHKVWMIRTGDQSKAGMAVYDPITDTLTDESQEILDIFKETPPETKSIIDAFVF